MRGVIVSSGSGFEGSVSDICGSPVSGDHHGSTRSMESLADAIGLPLDGFHLEMGIAKGSSVRSSCMNACGMRPTDYDD